MTRPLRLLLPALLLAACSTTGVDRGGRSSENGTDTGTSGDTATGDTSDSDTATSDTSGGSADTSTEPGQPGDPCSQNGDCESGACLSSGAEGRRCAASCTTADNCVAGWDCLPLGGAGTFCQCAAATESCNGEDDDCDLQIDEGTDADLGCTGLEQCTNGACRCDGALLYCGSLCTDLNTDPTNCGDCGNACPTGFSCAAGTCTCDAPSIVCDGACANLDTDTANCGECGLACAPTLSCIEGLCTCAPGQQNCGGACADTSADPNNCGGCGIACGPTQTCDGGTCTCPVGFSACGAECRNLTTDPDNCGLCGAVCTDIQSCVAGDCTCPDGGVLCAGRCTSTSTDPANCGGCGIACANGGLCNAGACACPGRQVDCGGDCTDTRIDEANCGACGRACSGLEECTGSTCTCPATATQCGADCTDTQTDPNNCGGCGIACAAGTDCVNGICGCPCGGNTCDLGACFITPPGAPLQTYEATFFPALQRLDLSVSMDTTGSMSTPITAVQGSLNSSLGTSISALGISTTFGVSRFADFPCSPYGDAADTPFSLRQRQTTNFSAASAAAAALSAAGGGDLPESGIEALYQIATGGGRATTPCSGGTGSFSIPAFNSATNRIAGVADGTIGGVGFRSGALPLILHITDAVSSARGESSFPYGAARAEATTALRNLGALVASIAVDSAFTGPATGLLTDLQGIASQTLSSVPVCAWDSARPAGCASNQCCTGYGRAGISTSTGDCPLVYRATSAPTATNFSDIFLDAARRATLNARYQVRAVVRRDEAEFARSGIDTSCLVSTVAANDIVTQGTCDPQRPAVSFTADGYNNAHTGDELGFNIYLANDCIPSTGSLRAFVVYFDLVGPNNAVLDTLSLSVAVP